MAMLRLLSVVVVIVFTLLNADLAATNKATSEKLSKEAVAIVGEVKDKLTKSLSGKCSSIIGVATSMATTDEKVYSMCKTVKEALAQSLISAQCDPSENDTIVKTICDTLSASKKDTSKKLSKEAAAIVSEVKEKLTKSLSDKCKPMISVVESNAKTDDKVYNMCNLVNGPIIKLVILENCDLSEYGNITKTICDTLAGTNKATNGKLSNEAMAIVDAVKDKLTKSLSAKCKPMIDVAASFATTDKQVYEMCSLVKGPIAKPLVTSNCSPEDYDKIVETICKELNETTDTGATKTVSKEVKTLVENLNTKWNTALSGTCKDMVLRVTGSIVAEDVSNLCQAVKKEKKAYMDFCSEKEYDIIAKETCDIISSIASIDGDETKNEMSMKATSVLQNILVNLTRTLSDKCKTLVKNAATLANTDEKVKNLCDSVKSQYKPIIVKSCSQADYDKTVKIVCDEVKDFEIPKTGGNDHENDSGGSKLSGKASSILNTIVVKLEKTLSGLCKSMVGQSTALADTDDKVRDMCDSVKLRRKATILTICSKIDYGNIVKIVCGEVKDLKRSPLSTQAKKTLSTITNNIKGVSANCTTTFGESVSETEMMYLCELEANVNNETLEACSSSELHAIEESSCRESKKLKADRLEWILSISGKVYYFSDSCKALVGSLPDLNTFKRIEDLCDDIKTHKESSFKKSCPNHEYGDLKQVVCEGGASAIMSSLVVTITCLVMFFLSKL